MKKLLKLLLWVLIGLIIMLLFNTVNFRSKQIKETPVKPIYFDDLSLERLQEAVQLKTVSQSEFFDITQFQQFDSLIFNNFPNLHDNTSYSSVGGFSHIFKWTGQSTDLKPILLIAHLDVVPAKNSDKWTYPPFQGKIDRDTIWGRGTLDDKTSVLAIMEAVDKLIYQGHKPTRDVYFAFGQDEEIGGEKGVKNIVKYFKNQGVHFEYVLDEGQIILKNALPGLQKPLAMIGVMEKGFASLKLEISLPNGGHTSMPPKETAIDILSKAIVKINNRPFPTDFSMGAQQLLENVGPEMSFVDKFIFSNTWFFKPVIQWVFSKKPTTNALLRTTTAFSIIQAGIKENVLPTNAEAIVNLRILPGETCESAKEHIIKLVNDDRINIDFSSTFYNDPLMTSSTSSFGYNVVRRTISGCFPESIIAPTLVIATTDSRYFHEITDDIYRFLPVVLDNHDLKRIHGFDECLSIQNYKEMINFYYYLIKNSSN